MKLKEKVEAIRLRKLGKGYNEIKERLGVSKSTLSLWLRNVILTPEQIATLKGRQLSAFSGGKVNREKRIKRTADIIAQAQQEAGELLSDPLFLAGLMLYWAEGSKRSGDNIKFSNSDPTMIRFMMQWIRKYCPIKEEKFRIALHVHELHCREDVENFWSILTGIPLSQFQKTYVKKTTLKYRKNPLYNGTCNIIIHNVDLFRRIQAWQAIFVSKFGLAFDVPVAQLDRATPF